MCKSRLFLCFSVALLMWMYGLPASARTPDGQTPSQEGVCDVLKQPGMTKGLYGLCVAYCEAHDSDLLATANSHAPRGSLERSRRILENYNKMRKNGDLEMPCMVASNPAPAPVPAPVVQRCPCWTAAEADAVDGVLSNGTTAIGWPAPSSEVSVCGADAEFPYINESAPISSPQERAFIRAANLISGTTQFQECQYVSLGEGWNVNRMLRIQDGNLTAEELASCVADIFARQAALGVCQ